MLLRELFEAQQSVGLIFGRFNPPHKGHKAAWEMASENSAWYVGTNQSTQGPKDPLPYDVKIKAMKTIWPEVAGHIAPSQSWLTLASEIYKKHGDVELKVYTDEEWVLKTLSQYNGVEGNHGMYKFSKITPVATPRLSSATALRTAVANNDPKAFADAAGVPANTPVDGKPFFDLVAEYLGQYKKEDVSPKDEKKFHNALDNLVHKYFGDSPDEEKMKKKMKKVKPVDENFANESTDLNSLRKFVRSQREAPDQVLYQMMMAPDTYGHSASNFVRSWYERTKEENGLNDVDSALEIMVDELGLNENFADGKVKGKSRPGRVKRSGASCNGSVTSLRKRAKNSSGEKARMYHWCANMKSGRKKK